MSKSKPISEHEIAEHEDALGIYFNDMLYEEDTPPQADAELTSLEDVQADIDDETIKPFQALLFDINGLQLAIRSQDILAILPWPEAPLEQSNSLVQSRESILGTYSHSTYQSHIINTARVVLPPQLQHNLAPPSFIIIFGEGKWGLSCHKINSVIMMTPKDIKWRKVSGARPWLAGTSVEKSCSLVNIAELVNSL